MNPDGLSYLDMGEAYLRGDWRMAINAYWSPLYSWLLGSALKLLKPTPSWEFPLAHLLNLLIYLLALTSFSLFWREFTTGQGTRSTALPSWVLTVLGYLLFLWTSLNLTTLRQVTPDMCVAAVVYLAAALLIRIRTRRAGWGAFAALGLVLGLGYLAKAAMFPLGLVFIGVTFWAAARQRGAALRPLTTALAFLAVAGPFVIVLSKHQGRPTFGDVAKIAYLRYVNQIMDYPARNGAGYALQKLSGSLEIREFRSRPGTYPPWYDPSRSYEGVTPYFHLRQQLSVLRLNVSYYYHLFFYMDGLIVAAILLVAGTGRGWQAIRDIGEQWHLLIPSISALVMYSLVYVEGRYIAPFVVLIWTAILGGPRRPEAQDTRRLASLAGVAVVAVLATRMGTAALEDVYSIARSLLGRQSGLAPQSQQIADGLKQLGVEPGEKVGYIGHPVGGDLMCVHPDWARLARVQIIAEMPCHQGAGFLMADPATKTEVLKAFSKTEAKAVVAKGLGSWSPGAGWRRLGETSYHVYPLHNGP